MPRKTYSALRGVSLKEKSSDMNRHWKTITAWLAGLAGLSSCESIEIIQSGMCMYGTPYADYDVDMVITDENGKPIEGISVCESWYGSKELTKSGADGKARLHLEHSSFCSMSLKDVDGEANGGEFEDMTISEQDLSLEQTKKGDKSWYKGRFNATGSVKMKKKVSE